MTSATRTSTTIYNSFVVPLYTSAFSLYLPTIQTKKRVFHTRLQLRARPAMLAIEEPLRYRFTVWSLKSTASLYNQSLDV